MASVRIDSIEPDLSRMTRLWIWVLLRKSIVRFFVYDAKVFFHTPGKEYLQGLQLIGF